MEVTCVTTTTTVMLTGHLVRRVDDEGTYGIWGNLAVPLPSIASSIPDGAMVCVQAYWVPEQQRWGMISILQVAQEVAAMVDDNANEAACAAQAQPSSPSVFAPADRAASSNDGSDEDGLSFVTSAVHTKAHATMEAENATKVEKTVGSRFATGANKRLVSEVTDATPLLHVANEAQPQTQSQPSVTKQSGQVSRATERPEAAAAHTKAATPAVAAQAGTRFGVGKKRLDELRAEEHPVGRQTLLTSAMNPPPIVTSVTGASPTDIPSVDIFEDQVSFDDIPF